MILLYTRMFLEENSVNIPSAIRNILNTIRLGKLYIVCQLLP